MGFPKSICTSVNEIMVHGIPDKRQLKNRDIVNIDITVYYKGFHGDISQTFSVGKPSDEVTKLLRATKEALYAGIKVCGPETNFNEIGRAIQEVSSKNNFISVEIFCGHGIGRNFHEYPLILMTGNISKLNNRKPKSI